jgi:hypothetical protein
VDGGVRSTVHVLVPPLALVVALAAATPAPTPFPLGTLVPFGAPNAPTPPPLPEIGRVRSATPSCAAMRDLVIPAFAAARRSDVKFDETRKRLPDYAELVADPLHRADIYRESALARIDNDATALLNEALTMSKALGDPRLANKADPEVVAEKNALNELYLAVQARANTLTEFVTRQRVAIAKAGIDDNSALFGGPHAPPAIQTSAPTPVLTAPPGMPVLVGNNFTDKAEMNQWSGDMSRVVRYYENEAAKTFLPIARKCR